MGKLPDDPRKLVQSEPFIRRLKYLEGKLAGKSSTQAARDAGFSEKTAKNWRVEVEGKAFYKDIAVWEIVREIALKNEDLLKIHKGLLESENENVRLKALALAYQIKGLLNPKPKEEKNDLEGL